MSVKQALLALLEQEPMYGYQLRTEFELRTGGTWPLNVGQVYTTLTRLERDGLVEGAGADAEDHPMYRLTEAGREEVSSWFTTPVSRTQPPRDELAIKLALAVTVPGVDVARVIQQQRSATMHALQDYTRLKRCGSRGPPRPGVGRWRGAWSSTPSSSRPRPRSAGWTTARPGCGVPRRTVRSPRRLVPRPPRPPRPPAPPPRARRPCDERSPAPRHRHPHPRRRRHRGPCPARGVVHRPRRRTRRRDGPVGLRQVHAADPGRRTRRSRPRLGQRRGRRPRDSSATRAAPGCGVRRSATSSRTST